MSLLARFSRFQIYIVSLIVLFVVSMPIAMAVESSTGSISGVVTDSSNGDPLTEVSVYLIDGRGINLDTVVTSVSGEYSLNGITAGEYFLFTSNSSGFFDEAYGDYRCDYICQGSLGTPVTVLDNTALSGIDFSLDRGGRISGTITDNDTGNPISGLVNVDNGAFSFTIDYVVSIYDVTGEEIGTANIDGEGNFISRVLPGGKYYLVTETNGSYVDEHFGGVPCVGECDLRDGDLVTVTTAETPSQANYFLHTAGQISGEVKDAETGIPISGAIVRVYDNKGNYINQHLQSNSEGVYSTGSISNYFSHIYFIDSFKIERKGLSSGEYYVRINNYSGYIGELYDLKFCAFQCDVTLGDSVTVVQGEVTRGIDFLLDIGGSIEGVITDNLTGEKLGNISVVAYDYQGNFVAYGITDENGQYGIRGLPTGNYYVTTTGGDIYIREIYGDIYCTDSCDVTTGSSIAVSQGEVTSGIDITLDIGGSISGVISDPDAEDLHSNIRIEVISKDGELVSDGYANINTNGEYRVSGLDSGLYTLRVVDNEGFYLNEVYGGDICSGYCDPKIGTAVNVTQGEDNSGINFTLKKAGSISGVVRDADTGTILRGISVEAYSADGYGQHSGVTDSNGHYIVGGLTSGNYYLVTENWQSEYVDEIYGGGVCIGWCDATSGTAVSVVQGKETSGIDFTLVIGGTISGYVTDSKTGAGIEGVNINIFDHLGNWVFTDGYTDENGYYEITGLAIGDYYLQTENYNEYIDQAYGGEVCLYCSSTSGAIIEVSNAEAVNDINFSLKKGGIISGSVLDEATGEPIDDSYLYVDFYDLDWNYAGGSSVISSGFYKLKGLPTGQYYALATNYSGYINEKYNDTPCSDSCYRQSGGSFVSVTEGEVTEDINFFLRKGGAISGRVFDEETGEGVENIEIKIFTRQGQYVTYAYTDETGFYKTNVGLLDGEYILVTSYGDFYINEAYGGQPVASISNFDGLDTVVISKGQAVENIDFTLTKGGGVITGVITSEDVESSNMYASIRIYNEWGVLVDYTNTDLDGFYITSSALPDGNYYVVAWAWGYIPVAYDGLNLDSLCIWSYLQCNGTFGQQIAIVNGETVENINFVLKPLVDTDNDGIPDYVESKYGLNISFESDALDDLDGDGIINIDEYRGGTSIAVDSTPPEFPPLNEVILPAIGELTPPGFPEVIAADLVDGDVIATPDVSEPLRIGQHEVTWTATDAAGNSATSIQLVNVLPQVNLGIDQIVGEGSVITVKAALNMVPESYPVEIPFTVSGTAENPIDHDAVAGVLVFTSSTEVSTTFNVVDDGIGGEADETVVIALQENGLAENYGVVLGNNKQQVITITESNLPPSLALQALQGGQTTRIVTRDGGAVTVKANVNDSNPNDSHSFDWSLTDNNLVDNDGNQLNDTFVFDPVVLASGFYSLHLKVIDQMGASATTDLMLVVIETAPLLSENQDSDGDSVVDSLEGYGDSDNDGVPDYLDAIAISSLLQGVNGEQSSYLLQVSPGLQLSLGTTALASGQHSAAVSEADVVAHGGDGGGLAQSTDVGYDYPAGLYDFEVSGMVHGSSVQVVLPQSVAIPDGAVYRKYIHVSGWQDFVVDAANMIASAPGVAGYCPPPGDSSFIEGLHPGDFCVQLKLEDGGPNDADGEINGSVKDPGGVAVVDTTPDQELNQALPSKPVQDSSQDTVANIGGGGGQIGWELLFLLIWWCYAIQIRRAGHYLR